MGRGSGSNSNVLVVREASRAMDQWKYEVAAELGIQAPQAGYWGEIPSRQCGAVGGHMVRKMIEMAERSFASGGSVQPTSTVR